jgi:hypothetical protein
MLLLEKHIKKIEEEVIKFTGRKEFDMMLQF